MPLCFLFFKVIFRNEFQAINCFLKGEIELSVWMRSIAKNSFIKLGAEGLLIHTDKKNHKNHTDKIAALNSSPIDFVGAGDSMLISSAMVMAVGGSIWDAALIGSIASAIQVSRFGNSPIKLNDLLREIKQ